MGRSIASSVMEIICSLFIYPKFFWVYAQCIELWEHGYSHPSWKGGMSTLKGEN